MSRAPERGRVDGHGTTLAYARWPGAGPALVGVHGITATHLNFVGIAERLYQRRPLLAVDLRGRGESEKPDGPYGLEVHARDVAAAMRALGLGPSVVVGHSLGAYVATALAASFPELVSGLVLIDGGHPFDLPPNIDVRSAADVALAPILMRLKRTYVDELDHRRRWRDQGIFAPNEWSDWMEQYLTYSLGGEPPVMHEKALERAVRDDFADILDGARVEARLQSLAVPVLLVRAELGFTSNHPPLISDGTVGKMRRLVPHLEDQLVRRVNHYTVALAEPGASIVAEAILKLADAVDGEGGLSWDEQLIRKW